MTKKKSQENTPFAVIETGGKQYKVAEGDVITIEKLAGEFKEGDKVTFDKVLLLEDGKDAKIGSPYIDGAKVEASFNETAKGKKLSILRHIPKSNRRRKVGHRQTYTKVEITKVA